MNNDEHKKKDSFSNCLVEQFILDIFPSNICLPACSGAHRIPRFANLTAGSPCRARAD
jgi:hypothetical protein